MKSSHIDPRALLDRLENKYARKLRIQKYKRQTKQRRQTLMEVRGMSVSNLKEKTPILFDIEHKLTS